MDKELFVNTIRQMEELYIEQEKFNDMLKSIDNEFGGGYIHSKSIDILYNLLKELVNDKQDDWIGYYLWELDFGKKYEDGMITEADGTIIKLSTPEELYDLIISETQNAEN